VARARRAPITRPSTGPAGVAALAGPTTGQEDLRVLVAELLTDCSQIVHERHSSAEPAAGNPGKPSPLGAGP
jgi:hypothetical protein